MAIRVTSLRDLYKQDFTDATSWHVDDHGYLHIIEVAAKGNAATFCPGAWSSVERVKTESMPSE